MSYKDRYEKLVSRELYQTASLTPAMFENIIGHDRAKKKLREQIEKPHHAYLFSGLGNIGKMSLIREFISMLSTSAPFSEQSVFGKQFLAGRGPNLFCFFDQGESLKIEEIRKIGDFAALRTGENEYSFCVVENAERLTLSGANAFLKMLEEPAPRFIFFLTTRKEKKILPTIMSRVQTLRLFPVSEQVLKNFLRTHESNEALIDEASRLSMGRIGLAFSLLKDEKLLERLRKIYDLAMIVQDKDLVDRFSLAEHLTQADWTDEDLSFFLQYLALHLRAADPHHFLSSLDRLQQLQRLFSDTQVNKRLFLEDLFLSFERT